METESRQDRLRGSLSSTYLEIISRSGELLERVDDAFKEAFETGHFDASVVSATLYLIGDLSKTLREAVDNGIENVIFPNDYSLKDRPPIQVQDGQPKGLLPKPEEIFTEEQGIEKHQDKPKTFDELLASKLGEVLPDGKESFTLQELGVFTGKLQGAREILESQERASFGREETITLLQTVLTTPDKRLDRTGEFDRKKILRHFPLLIRAPDLDKWSLVVGHDWSKTREVDFETAMQIRGLGMLSRLSLPPKTPK